MKKLLITALVALHLAASLWHGSHHAALNINLSPAQNLFVVIVILIAPVLSAILIWTRLASIGFWLFAISMLGAFLFGGYHHYVLVSADNIHFLPGGNLAAGHQFKISAGLIALLELASALFGVACLAALSSGRTR